MTIEKKKSQILYPYRTVNYTPPDTVFDKVGGVVIIISSVVLIITIVVIIGYLICKMLV